MIFEVIFLLLLSLFNSSFAQFLDCAYSGNYQCHMILRNPNGFDNFTRIGGTHLPGKSDSQVTILTTDSGFSLNVPSIICEQFPNLIEITLSGRKIEILTAKSFAGCKRVKKIHVWNNKIKELPVDLLLNNRLLEVFRVYTNNIVDPLPEGIFDPTPNLNFFCQEENPTGKFLPKTFRGLTKMDELHIDNMNLTELADCLLKPMIDLRYLRAHENQIQVLHQKSFPITKKNLQYIYFQYNLIEAIDRRIFNDTPSLMTVDFYNNKCTNLRTTNFNANRTANLAALEPCFAEYDRRFLIVNGSSSGSTCNFIQHPIYGYTCELINYDPKVPIINIHPDCFSDSDVTGVIIKDSKIPEIPPNIFETFPNVIYIEAKDVGIKSGLIENCSDSLKFIDVSENSIKSLPSNSFNCLNIETIIVNNNCLTSIQPCEVNFMSNLKYLRKVSMKETACVDKEFDLLRQSMKDIENELKKCFAWWYFN